MSDTLLIELRTEELPPKALENLGNVFAQTIFDELVRLNFVAKDGSFYAFASPRRLAVQIHAVESMAPDQNVTRKGPAVASAMKDGTPTPALLGFARSCGVDVSALTIQNDGKQDVYAYEFTQAGQSLESQLNGVIETAIKKLPIPKVMRWGNSPHQFVRPVHGLMILHGSQTLVGSVLGLNSQNSTLGHRFLSTGLITLNHADDYARVMAEDGKVIASFTARYALIEKQLNDAAKKLGATIAADDALLNEVTALVEFPVTLEAGFDAHFLQVPQECLILTMQQNQKYFPLLDNSGKLMNRFLLVSNLKADDSSQIIQGNERVLKARLSDAEFFFEQDKKHSLESRLPKLNDVVYHNKLGSQMARVTRLQTLASSIAKELGANTEFANRAALLAKADLVTDMVGEFPELQGTMGKYYAIHDGEPSEVCQAIENHYRPRFAGDDLPPDDIATSVSLADKLESLVGIWGIGLIPTGDKDPYALRRATLGILRMLLQKPLSLPKLVQAAFDTLKDKNLDAQTCTQVYEFALARLSVLLQNEFDHDVIEAVLSNKPEYLDNLHAKLQAVAEFKKLPEATALAGANKRVQNILKKNATEIGSVNQSLLQETQEQALYDAMQKLSPDVTAHLTAQNFTQALTTLAALSTPIDAFFEHIMVMCDDAAVKQNRLNLLNELSHLFNGVANIALLNE